VVKDKVAFEYDVCAQEPEGKRNKTSGNRPTALLRIMSAILNERASNPRNRKNRKWVPEIPSTGLIASKANLYPYGGHRIYLPSGSHHPNREEFHLESSASIPASFWCYSSANPPFAQTCTQYILAKCPCLPLTTSGWGCRNREKRKAESSR